LSTTHFVHIFDAHWWSQMHKYLMQVGNTFYFRRRIPTNFSHFFQNKAEFRIKLGKISNFQGIMYSKELNKLYEELYMLLQTDTTNKKELIYKYTNTMLSYSNKSSQKYKVHPFFSLPDLEKEREELNKQLHEKIDTLSFKEKKKLLEDMDIFNKLVQVIDPKKDFANQKLQTTPKTQKANISLQELYALFIKEKKQEVGEDIAQSTWRDYQSSYNDFIFVHPDAEHKDIAEFTREDFRIFVDALHNHLPKSRTKFKQFKALSYSQLKSIELNEDEKMAFETKKKKISTIKQMFDIAADERYGYIEKNLAEAFTLKTNKKSKKKGRETKTSSYNCKPKKALYF